MKNYYEPLGVRSDADEEVVKAVYRRLALKYHPDVAKDPDAEERFLEIQEAASVLLDLERRRRYDASRRRAARPRLKRRAEPEVRDVVGLVIDVLGIRVGASIGAAGFVGRRRRPARNQAVSRRGRRRI